LRAAYIHGVRDVRVGDKPEPKPGRGDVLIRVAGVGICGSDLHYFTEGAFGSARGTDPFVPGHEIAGWVLEDRPDLGLKAGALAAIEPAKFCGHCEWCKQGHPNLCPNVEFLGAPPFHGAMTERIAVTPAQVFALPTGLSVAQAVMLEPLGVALHAVDLAKIEAGETVAVLGCGPIGLCLVQLARAAGAGRIYATDPADYRAAAAKRLGADEVGRAHTQIADWTEGRGVDLVLEATNATLAFQHAAETVRIGGRLVLVGIPEGDRYTLGASLVRRKGISVKLSRRMGHVYPRVIAMAAEKRIDLDSLVTHRLELEDTAKGFELGAECREGALKSIVYPNGVI
jgi:L-iditol 2-dehydrogenase